MQDIFEHMQKIIAEQFAVDPDEITMNTSFEEDLGADSLAAMELVMALEEAFEVEIDDAELDQFKTVGDLADYLENKAQ